MSRAKRLISFAGPALLVFLAAEALLSLSATRSGLDPRRPATFVRWDSVRYLSIATHGYFIEVEDGHVTDGNVAWFPGYPLAIRAVGRLRVAAPRAGRYLSLVFAWAVLLVLSAAFLEGVPWKKRALLLLLAGFFPGFVYHHAVFPISMTATFALLSLAAAARARFAWAGFWGALACFTYSTAVLLVAVLALAVLLQPGVSAAGRAVGLSGAPGLAVAGYLSAFAYQHRSVPWGSFGLMQRDYYQAGLHNPADVLAWNTRHLFSGALGPGWTTSVQTLLVALLVVGAAALCWRHRRTMTRLDWLLLASGVVFWLAPQVVGGRVVSVYRSESLLVFLVPLLRRLPAPALSLLLAVFAVLGYAMSRLFFDSILI